MVDTMEDLLDGEVYHYYSKIAAKEPREGSTWEWHQD
jgi:ectoine hydroxylase